MRSLALAAVGRRVDDGDIARQHLHSVRFDHGVQDKGGAGLALTPVTVAAVHEQGLGEQAVAHVTAGAAAVVENLVRFTCSCGALACGDLDFDLHARVGQPGADHHRRGPHVAEVVAQDRPAFGKARALGST